MSKQTTSFALGDHFRSFAERKVREGRYASASEVVRAGLRLLEAEEQRIEALRAAIDEGESSGPAEPFNVEEFLKQMRQHG
jgi:antitoxin ParD1/3/4